MENEGDEDTTGWYSLLNVFSNQGPNGNLPSLTLVFSIVEFNINAGR